MKTPLRFPLPLFIPICLILVCCAAVVGRALYLAVLARSLPITKADFPRIDGSTSTDPIRTLVACKAAKTRCRWLDIDSGERFLRPIGIYSKFPDIGRAGTHGAYENLITGKTDLILVARLPSADELALARQNGVELETRPIALDAFVFIANQENPVKNLTQAQILGIYTGKLTNWKEVGGKDMPIYPYQRDRNSGSQELMETLVLKGLKPIDAPTMTDSTMSRSFYRVSNETRGLAYSIYYYEEKIVKRPDVKNLAVDGITPGARTIRNKTYPFVTEVYAAIRKSTDASSSAYRLMEWLQGEAGQRLIYETGYLPVTPPRFP